jgi:hypothetical protein
MVRLWYAGRAVPWAALLACAALAAALTGAMNLWEQMAAALLPLAVVATAAAAGFLFDDHAVAVTSVTPRGRRWAPVTRLALAAVPVAVWLLLLPLLPGSVPLDTAGWWLIGAGACLLAAGVAGLAARGHQSRPGGMVATMLALLAIVPMVVGPFLDWEPVFPIGDFPGWAFGLWGGIAAVGAAMCAIAVLAPVRGPSARE